MAKFPNLSEMHESDVLMQRHAELNDMANRLVAEAWAVEYATRRARGEGLAEAAKGACRDIETVAPAINGIYQAAYDAAESAHREKWGI